MKLARNFNPKFLIGIFIFLLSLSVYIYTANPQNPGYADSDEIISISSKLGLLHPSGYQLTVIFTKLFTLLPIPGSIAFKANLLNSFIHSLTLVFIFLIGVELLEFIHKSKNQFLIYLSAFTGSLILGFSALFWLYSGISEVAPLNDLISTIVVFCAFKWKKSIENNLNSNKWLFLTTIFSGLGISHIHTFILIGPFLLFIYLSTLKKNHNIISYLLKKIIPVFLIFLLSFSISISLIYLLAKNNQNISWYIEPNLKGVWEHFIRKAYTGFYVEKNLQAQSYLGNFDPGKYLNAVPIYLAFLFEHFTFIGFTLAILGIFYLYKKNREYFYYLSFIFLFTGLIFAARLGIPSNNTNNLLYRSEIGIIHRQYLLGETFFSIFIIIGIYSLFSLINSNKQKVVQIFLSSLVISILFSVNLKTAYQKNNSFAYDYAYKALTQVEKNSVILCSADFSCFSLFYLQEVVGYRQDIIVLPKNSYYKKNFLLKNPQYTGLNYTEDPYLLTDQISWNYSQGRNVYLADLIEFYIDFIGFKGDPYYLIPQGYLFKVSTKVPDKISSSNYEISQKLLSYNFSNKDYLLNGLKDYFTNFHTISGTLYGFFGYKDEANLNFDLALKLSDNSYSKASLLKKNLPAYQIADNFKPGKESSSAAQYLQLAAEFNANDKINEAYKMFQKATLLDPKGLEARLELARIYKLGGYYQNASKEYENLIFLNPNNQEIKKEYEALKSSIKGN